MDSHSAPPPAEVWEFLDHVLARATGQGSDPPARREPSPCRTRRGAIAQGAAQAFLEEVIFDADGNPLTSSFADYRS